MVTLYKKIGTHSIEFNIDQHQIVEFIENSFFDLHDKKSKTDLNIKIALGYGTPFVDYKVNISEENGKVIFKRSDYLIQAEHSYSSVNIFVNNELALKHALMNLYSAYIVYHNWGLLIHSSCAIQDGEAHIFAGESGAGKSTVARLSQPRELLSDEATLVKITPDKITIINSPFRSELTEIGSSEIAPLKSIQILHQSIINKRDTLKKADALVDLIDKVFYWAHTPEETKNIIGLMRLLVERVPTYNLYFKKDETFWELIS
ncbi:hypothetical protein F4694_000591 [Bacillus niacini]|uniref:Aldolase n=1 Tax=Neobacillus niacini TaxID=86668 RepID=A0A852T588_9BACI|nr:hypothetical protein [Neobacillus niacini]NYE03872.1 hypothetical protein [Neobacillus niacini]